jgi:hypothetical protein
MSMTYALVERDNRLAVHGLFDTLASAERHLAVNVPTYCERGYFMDKTLTPDSFIIIERKR